MTLMAKIAFGAWQIGGGVTLDGQNKGWKPLNESKAINLLQKAHEKGIHTFDTSASYGDGVSEKLIGNALVGVENVEIGTKYGWITKKHKQKADFRKDFLLKSLELSLKRLKRDKIAYFLMHSPQPEDITEEVLETLKTLKQQQIIKAFGISISFLEPFLKHISSFDIVECLYNPITTQNASYFSAIKPTKIYVRSLFASGLLLKKESELNPKLYSDWRSSLPEVLWEKATDFAIKNPSIDTRFKNIIKESTSIPEIDKCIVGFSDESQLDNLN